MISADLEQRLHDLREQGEPVVTATVVRTLRPTSAQPGGVALIRADGSIEGFVGGVCAQHSVRLYALQVIESGEPIMLRIEPDEDGAETVRPVPDDPQAGHEIGREEGIVTVHNPCLSGGTIELFLEPSLPAPRVVAIGESPIVEALADLGPRLGLAIDTGAGRDAPAPAAGDLALVVSAHGRDEVAALCAGLEAGVPYVGLVASATRGGAVLDEMRAAGVEEDLVARVDTPAGIAIGARTPAEVALAILARVVAVRRAQGTRTATPEAEADAFPGAGARAAGPQTAVDPVCGMTVVVLDDTLSVEHDGETAYFCCEGCRDRFLRQLAA
ncbi:MAG TPA: XdhC family protein [Solirubrobacterales bacterium]|nr:XdhC family protein [Solirubrobacterales bacterium]